MYFKTLYIYSKQSEKLLKKYDFNKYGLNIILGEKRENDNETNGVGKTTMVECLSFLLGKAISKNYQNSPQLLEKDIYIILEISRGKDSVFLGRVFTNPKYGYIQFGGNINFDTINWKRYTDKLFRSEVEALFIDPPLENITFAALREYIIRDEKSGYNNITLPNRKAIDQYRYLNYLFDLPYNNETLFKNLKLKQDELSLKIKLIDSLGANIAELKVEAEKVQTEIGYLDDLISRSKTVSHYNDSLELYKNKKNALKDLHAEIFEVEHIIKQYNKNIDNLENKLNEIKQLDDIEGFYQELIGYFPNNIKENYTDIKNFYDFMVKSRGGFFYSKIEKQAALLKDLKSKAIVLENELNQISKTISSTELVEDLAIMMEAKKQKEIELAQIDIRIADYNLKYELQEQINNYQQDIIRLAKIKKDEFDSLDRQIKNIQLIFKNLTFSAYNQRGFLEIDFDNRIVQTSKSTPGRLIMKCSIPDENSHGRLHMKIIMFDLTWLIYRIMSNLNIKFLIHDGSYSNPDSYVKGKILKYIDKFFQEYRSGQYFITINTTELLQEDLEELRKKNLICAELNKLNGDNNRFFGFKFL